MSTLTLLPLIRVTDGVQLDEDWRLSIAFYLNDGVTPIDLSSLEFTLTVGALATLSSGGGQLLATGPSSNILAIAVLASAKASWPSGVYALTLTASDGISAQDVFALSTLTVGSPQAARVSLLVTPDPAARSIASPISAALAEALQALQPTSLAGSLAGLSGSQLEALSQALFATLPVQTGVGVPVSAGQAFINNSGYVVIAQ